MRLLSMHVLSEANACMWSPITLLFKPLLLSLSEAARAALITLSGVTLAAATASATLSIEAAALAFEARAPQAAHCSARAPVIALSGVTLAAAAASATLLFKAASSSSVSH